MSYQEKNNKIKQNQNKQRKGGIQEEAEEGSRKGGRDGGRKEGRRKQEGNKEKERKRKKLILGGSKITADGDCGHEIKRRLLLGRKVMTNLDRIFKSRDITLPTKVRLVKAMVFPVVMYGCESWTVKKAEHQTIDAFEL